MSADDLVVFGASGVPGHRAMITPAAVSMIFVGVVTTNRPAISVATVRVVNGGAVVARPRVFAVDDWSSSGPVPAEPPRVELAPGRHRDVLVRMRRPWLRPLSRRRTGAVSIYADIDGTVVAGPQYEVPPTLRWAAVVAAVVVLLAGLGTAVLRPIGRPGDSPPGAASTVPVVRSSPPHAADPGDAPDGSGLPADVVFDGRADDDANTHTPVLVDRDRGATPLPPGGQVTAAVKVPSGWVVKRRVNGDPAGARFHVSYLRGREVKDLAPGAANPLFRVDGTGTRVLIDGRDGRAGTVTVISLPAGTPEAAIALPAHVRVVDWLGTTVLVDVDDGAGSWRYDRWLIGRPYDQTPSTFEGSYLGVAGDALVIHQRDGTLDCIVRVPDLFRPAGQAFRCGFGVPIDGDVLRRRWSAVSPGGRHAAVPGPNGSAYFAPLAAMLNGRAGFAPATGLPGPIVDITWRDPDTAAVLVHGDDAHIWTCAAGGGACRATSLDRPSSLFPVQLVARVPAGR
jgi:hypothetical protein